MEEPYLAAFIRMMPRLQAEAQQRQIDALVIAGGRQVSDRSYRQLVDDLQRQADGRPPIDRRPVRARSLKQIAELGPIRVTRENAVAAAPRMTYKPGDRPGRMKQEREAAAAAAAAQAETTTEGG